MACLALAHPSDALYTSFTFYMSPLYKTLHTQDYVVIVSNQNTVMTIGTESSHQQLNQVIQFNIGLTYLGLSRQCLRK